MTQNAALDVAIGLILMYLMLSLLCTVVNEYVATKMKIRAKTLDAAIQQLIDDPALLAQFAAHGMISSNRSATATGAQSVGEALVSAPRAIASAVTSAVSPNAPPTQGGPTARDMPSYLAGGTVALALLGSVLKLPAPEAAPANNIPPLPGASAQFNALAGAINSNLAGTSKVRDALQSIVLQAEGDMDKLKLGIATWFDDAMERLSGAYKRKMKWIGLLVAMLVAIAFNADTFFVAKALWNDPDRRASAVAAATQAATRPLPKEAAETQLKEVGDTIRTTESTLRALPIGWPCTVSAERPTFQEYWKCAQDNVPNISFVQFLGWFLTALALTLGAPFWFDLLNKVINIRGAGGKPQREDAK